MKRVLILMVLVFVGTAGWRIGNNLSSDAISMAVGIFFGVLAGIPTALLVLASDRRRSGADSGRHGGHQGPSQPQVSYAPYGAPQQPPVIILNGGDRTPTPPGGRRAYLMDNQYHPVDNWPQAQRPARRFKLIGEQEEWLE
jgi:hypothetical protein